MQQLLRILTHAAQAWDTTSHKFIEFKMKSEDQGLMFDLLLLLRMISDHTVF